MTVPNGLKDLLKYDSSATEGSRLIQVGVGDRSNKIRGESQMVRSGSAKLVNKTTISVNSDTKQQLESLMCDGEILDTTLLRILNEYKRIVNNYNDENDSFANKLDFKPLELICETQEGKKFVVPIKMLRSSKTNTVRAYGKKPYGAMNRSITSRRR